MSHHAAELLAGAQPLWTEAAAYDEARRLLRLALLRDLVRTLHAERSRLMALRQPDRAETLKKLEPILERLRTCELDSFDLAGLVNGDEPQNPLKEEPQDPRLDRILGEGKLDRYDRAWEAAMAVEALKRGWLFWALDTQVEVPKAEAFHLGLGQRL
ncbi:MAG TPA: hypothetical protein VL588_05425, partial [Bdellovibrionota bacterium]|nr:hypothetical protein [Bdellovibrionota bacterium]